jgi:hypothetical protein
LSCPFPLRQEKTRRGQAAPLSFQVLLQFSFIAPSPLSQKEH